jgi:hypothetical protein
VASVAVRMEMRRVRLMMLLLVVGHRSGACHRR